MPFDLFVIKLELINFARLLLYVIYQLFKSNCIYLDSEMTVKFSNFNFRKINKAK